MRLIVAGMTLEVRMYGQEEHGSDEAFHTEEMRRWAAQKKNE
jgi:hypothetical protein